MTNLTTHFTLTEAAKSQAAERLGIDNQPGMAIIAKLVRTANHILEPVRANYGKSFSPSSWYRCLELNRRLGSKDTSRHVKGEAVDFEVPGVDNLELAHWINDNLDFDQLILEFYDPRYPSSGWVHCSYVSQDENRGEVLTIQSKGILNAGLPKLFANKEQNYPNNLKIHAKTVLSN